MRDVKDILGFDLAFLPKVRVKKSEVEIRVEVEPQVEPRSARASPKQKRNKTNISVLK